MSRITATFERAAADKRLVLAPFITVGYPDLSASIELALAYAEAGAEMLEIGVPFSDPIADGPTVQRASQQALDHGVTLTDCLGAVASIREGSDIPLLLMGYANPFYQRGLESLAADLATAGGDGLIVPDVLPEVSAEAEGACQDRGLAFIYFVAPTTPPDRLAKIGSRASGFIYCVSVTGVTGSRDHMRDDLPAYLARVGDATNTPRVVGFGISKPEHISSLHGVAEGVIVASVLIDTIDAAAPGDAVDEAATLVRAFSQAAQCGG